MSKKIAMALLVAVLVQPVLGLLPFTSEQAQACCNPIKWIKKKFKRNSTQPAQNVAQQELPVAPQVQRESTVLNTEYLANTEAAAGQGSVQYGILPRNGVVYETFDAADAKARSLANKANATERHSTVSMLENNPTMPAGGATGARISGGPARVQHYQRLPPEPEPAAEAATGGEVAAVEESITARNVNIAGEAAAAKSKLRQTDSLAAREIRSVAARRK